MLAPRVARPTPPSVWAGGTTPAALEKEADRLLAVAEGVEVEVIQNRKWRKRIVQGPSFETLARLAAEHEDETDTPFDVVGSNAFRSGTRRRGGAARGIDLPDWNGERVREWVATDGWEMFPAAALPAVQEARDWLLREMNADVAQAIGRLRAVWATERVDVEIYGFLPILGFGLKVDEMRLEGSGRTHHKASTRGLAMEAIVDLGDERTRKGISDYIYQHGGGRVSNTTIDCCIEEAQAYALRHRLTLLEAARTLCQITNDLLKEHGNDAMAACLAADSAGIPGATLLALVIEQGRRAQPGAQRAGP